MQHSISAAPNVGVRGEGFVSALFSEDEDGGIGIPAEMRPIIFAACAVAGAATAEATMEAGGMAGWERRRRILARCTKSQRMLMS